MGLRDSPKTVLAVVTSCHAVNHMYQGILPLLYTPILRELGLSYTELGLIIGTHLALLGFLQFGSSILSRYVQKRVLLGLGNILLGVGNFAVGLSTGFFGFLGGRLIAAIGGSPQHPVGTSLISERFSERERGSALGAHFSFAFVGNIVGPVAAGIFLIYLGWRLTLYILIVPALAVGLLAILLLKEHPSKVEEGPPPGVWSDLRRMMTNKTILLLLLAQLFANGAGQGVLTNYIPLVLTDSFGLSAEGTDRLFFYVLFLVGGVAGPLLVGRLSDILGRRIIGITIPLSTSLLLYLFLTAFEPSLAMAAVLLLLGITSFSIPIIIQAMLSDITTSSLREITLGIYYTETFIFAAVWVGAIGYFADLYQTFIPVMMAGSLSMLAVSVFLSLGSKGSAASKTY